MRLRIDHDRCEGHGVCEAVAPDLFRLDEHGDLVLLVDPDRLPEELHEPAEMSVRACPVAALSVED